MNPRKETNRIFWHCTAHREGQEVTYDDLWRIHVEQNGWSHIGYHYLIQLDGTVVECRPEDRVGAGASGHNADSVHISYAGGMDAEYKHAKDTRTQAQKDALYALTQQLLEKYGLDWEDVWGHNEVSSKACPSFDVDADIAAHFNAEPGDPEPGDPGDGAIGLRIKQLETENADLKQRVRAIESYLRSV